MLIQSRISEYPTDRLVASMLPLQSFHTTSLRLSNEQKRQHSVPCNGGAQIQSPWETTIFSQDHRFETPDTDSSYYNHDSPNNKKRGPMARALMKTGKVLRRLSGVKKHGRKPSVNHSSLYNHAEVDSFHRTYYSNSTTHSCAPERVAQELAETGPMLWTSSTASRGLSSSHLDSTEIVELSGVSPRMELSGGSPRIGFSGVPSGTESSPTSPVSSTGTSPTLCAELESPLGNGHTDDLLPDKSAVSTALTSVPQVAPHDLTVTTPRSRMAKCSRVEPPPYDEQKSWLLDIEDPVAHAEDAKNTTTTQFASQRSDNGKECPRDAKIVVSNRVPDFQWPTPTGSVYRPSALNLWIVNVATVKFDSIRPLEISQHVLHLKI